MRPAATAPLICKACTMPTSTLRARRARVEDVAALCSPRTRMLLPRVHAAHNGAARAPGDATADARARAQVMHDMEIDTLTVVLCAVEGVRDVPTPEESVLAWLSCCDRVCAPAEARGQHVLDLEVLLQHVQDALADSIVTVRVRRRTCGRAAWLRALTWGLCVVACVRACSLATRCCWPSSV